VSARPIGQIVRGILARCEAIMGLQALLDACDCAADRETLIRQAHLRGSIGDDEAQLLVRAYRLEAA
jgi:hypothetical protein